MPPPIAAVFLRDGRQSAAAIASLVAGYIDEARSTLDLALYDMHLDGDARAVLAAAFDSAHSRGVRMRVLYNVEPARREDPMPKTIDWSLLHSLPVESKAVKGTPFLFHHKYCIRDGQAVLMGSANWTDDSWSRMENVLVRVESAALAAFYSANFEELWARPVVEGSGHQLAEWVEIAEGVRARAFFHPRRAHTLVHTMAARLGQAERRIRIASPVLTSGPLLAALAEMVDRPARPPALGVLDRTQTLEVIRAWKDPTRPVTWKLHALDHVLGGIPFSGKPSTPWAAHSVHDFMHVKCTVIDDCVFVGSFNLSHSGETNAENVLEIESPALADMFAGYIESVAADYPRLTPQGSDI